MRRILLFACLFLGMTMSTAYAQTRVVQGKVTSAEDGLGLPGVNVVVKGTSDGTVTDIDGNYRIDVNSDNAVLVFTFIGYQTVEESIGSRSVIDVSMDSDIKQLGEVVVVGYGEQKSRDVTSSIASVSGEDIKNQPVPSMESAIQGRAAGVNISASSGVPGAGLRVSIRGTTSISASSEPLYVVDGIPMVPEDNSVIFTGGYSHNPMADINPDDIASIQILKDASAASIYGSRGANGVVLITTKRGQAGKPKFNAGYYHGWQRPVNTIEMMNSAEFIEMMDEAAANDGFGEDYFSGGGPGFNFIGDPDDPDLRNTDWYEEIFRTAPVENYDLSASGGTESIKYYVGGSYYNQEGYMLGSDFERISGRVNLDFQATDKFKMGTTLNFARTRSRRPIGDNSLYGVVINALAADPTMPVREDDGTYASPFAYYSWWAYENPVLSAEEYDRNTFTYRGLGSLWGEYELAEGLKFKTSWSVDNQNLIDRSYIPSFTQQSIDGGTNGEGIYATALVTTWINENTLTYNTLLGEGHQISALVGYTQQETTKDFSDMRANQYPVDNLGNLALAANPTLTSQTGTSWGLESYLARVNYSFNDKYLLTLTARVDGSSRFGDNNRYGTFPSASFAWRASDEAFLQGNSWLSDLKLRVSYGLTGNQELGGNFSSRPLYGLTSNYRNTPGGAFTQLGNEDLSWETTSQFDIGFDAAAFEGRVAVTFDYFYKKTTDLLLNSRVPAYSGSDVVTRNLGEVENKGWELSVNSVNIDGAVKWTTNFNISSIDNKILSLVNDGERLGTSHILKEGEPLGTFFLIPWEGVDPQTGNSIYTDTNGDGFIDSDDAQIAGNVIPDFFGGISNTITYKNFDFTVFAQFSVGNEIWNHSRYAYEQVGWSFDFGGFYLPYGNNSQRVVDGRWQQPGDVTDIPRASLGVLPDGTRLPQNWQEDSDQWLEDGSYLRIKQLTLGYNVPKESLSRIGLETARLYVQGANIFTITNYLGQDPEVSSNGEDVRIPGEDFGALGLAKTWTVGVKVGF